MTTVLRYHLVLAFTDSSFWNIIVFISIEIGQDGFEPAASILVSYMRCRIPLTWSKIWKITCDIHGSTTAHIIKMLH